MEFDEGAFFFNEEMISGASPATYLMYGIQASTNAAT
jgi:hypothetical protein